jgi:molecular chaperone GrpE (heat shock protein)
MNHDTFPNVAGVATANHDQAGEPASPEQPLPQIQQRLFQLAIQVEQMQARLESLADESETSGDQLRALIHHLTNTQATHTLDERLAELATQLATEQEQLATLVQRVETLARHDQLDRLAEQVAGREQLVALTQSIEMLPRRNQIERLLESMAEREQVDALTQNMEKLARHDQIDQLLTLVAERDQLASLEETIRKLSRTQFKSNTLGETREQQVANALATLQEIATRREQQQESQGERNHQQLADARSEGRTLMAAELLPALDSVELALANGQQLLARQHTQIKAAVSAQQAYINALTDALTPRAPQPETAERGFWQRLWGPAADPADTPPPLPEAPADRIDEVFQNISQATTSWLQGLNLVRDRFFSLLAGEGIQPIDALHQPFDPRLHVAVETEMRNDVAPDTVVRVVRQGYRQQHRILRYAEVVVARPPTTQSTVSGDSL